MGLFDSKKLKQCQAELNSAKQELTECGRLNNQLDKELSALKDELAEKESAYLDLKTFDDAVLEQAKNALARCKELIDEFENGETKLTGRVLEFYTSLGIGKTFKKFEKCFNAKSCGLHELEAFKYVAALTAVAQLRNYLKEENLRIRKS